MLDSNQKKISVFVIGALPSSLVNFRGHLLKRLCSLGLNVTGMGGHDDVEVKDVLESYGCKYISYPVSRNGLSIGEDFKTLKALSSVFRINRPNIVLAYTIKPVIWSGVACRLFSKDVNFYAMITGLGYAFHADGIKGKLIRYAVMKMYQYSLAKAEKVFFQNKDNMSVFVKNGLVNPEKCRLVNGSGVDLDMFDFTPMPSGKFTFLCIGRLLGDKGFREYSAAARHIKELHLPIEILIVGPLDPSPDGISIEEVDEWVSDGIIKYLGAKSDVREVISSCHVFVLPSYHEGLPRTVVEAMAMGRPILTTDVPGCRETVEEGVNGRLIRDKSSKDLAENMLWFYENRACLEDMGRESRILAEKKFDVHKVNKDILLEIGVETII